MAVCDIQVILQILQFINDYKLVGWEVWGRGNVKVAVSDRSVLSGEMECGRR